MAESVSENLLLNLSIKNRTAESKNESNGDPSCFLRDSLQLQHTTNLNIQRSQSSQRFTSNIVTDNNYDHDTDSSINPSLNYINPINLWGELMRKFDSSSIARMESFRLPLNRNGRVVGQLEPVFTEPGDIIFGESTVAKQCKLLKCG